MHDLTDIDEFTTPITVPDGTDSRNNAAEVVEAIAQALANRTFALATHSAYHDEANTFSEVNTFQESISAQQGIQVSNPAAGEPAITQYSSPDDDPAPGNRWKSIIQAAIGGALGNTAMWSGIPSHDGQLLFTINAYWDATNQLWNQSTNTLHSFALMMSHAGVVTASRVNSGSAAWASWPVTGTSLFRAGSVAAIDVVTAGGNITAGGSINAIANVAAGVDVTAVDDVVAGGDFEFATPRTEYRAINLTGGTPSGEGAFFNGSAWVFGSGGAPGAASFPIVERNGTVLKQMRFIVSNPSGTDDATYNINLIRMHGQSFGSATPPTLQTIDSELANVLAGETKTVTLEWGDLTVGTDEWYFVYMAGELLPDTEHRLRAMQLQATRLGPNQ